MKCPYCKSENTGVIDSRLSDDGESVRRRRQCEECGKRFTTYERTELSMPMIVKTNGNRTSYDREKIHTGFMRALHKRPVPTEYVDQAVERIVQHVLGLGEREIPSRQIGERSNARRQRAPKSPSRNHSSIGAPKPCLRR